MTSRSQPSTISTASKETFAVAGRKANSIDGGSRPATTAEVDHGTEVVVGLRPSLTSKPAVSTSGGAERRFCTEVVEHPPPRSPPDPPTTSTGVRLAPLVSLECILGDLSDLDGDDDGADNNLVSSKPPDVNGHSHRVLSDSARSVSPPPSWTRTSSQERSFGRPSSSPPPSESSVSNRSNRSSFDCVMGTVCCVHKKTGSDKSDVESKTVR